MFNGIFSVAFAEGRRLITFTNTTLRKTLGCLTGIKLSISTKIDVLFPWEPLWLNVPKRCANRQCYLKLQRCSSTTTASFHSNSNTNTVMLKNSNTNLNSKTWLIQICIAWRNAVRNSSFGENHHILVLCGKVDRPFRLLGIVGKDLFLDLSPAHQDLSYTSLKCTLWNFKRQLSLKNTCALCNFYCSPANAFLQIKSGHDQTTENLNNQVIKPNTITVSKLWNKSNTD